MQIYSKTDKGLVREINQDACRTGMLSDSVGFAIVCDGMGGANAGDVASSTAVDAITDYITKSYRGTMGPPDLEKMAKNALESANIQLYDMALNHPDYAGMGTTAVLAILSGNSAVIAHVGDSRIYLVNDTITQLTKDHSVVQTLIESGKFTPEDAKVHPRKNVITRAIGSEETVAVDLTSLELNEGDILLLCTDGLTNFTEVSDITEIMKTEDLSGTPDLLIQKANQNGGGDNITVVVMSTQDSEA